MAIAMPNRLVEDWLNVLGYGNVGAALISNKDQIGRRAFAAELCDLLDRNNEFWIDAVFVVESMPTICFVDGSRITTSAEIDAIRQKLWNQDLTSALVVLNPGELRAFPIAKVVASESIDSLPRANARIDGKWSAVEVQSSDLQQRLTDWFDPNRRVDRDLLKQLGRAVTALTAGAKPPVRSQLQAQMLIAQVLFISYLEHRGVVGEDYRQKHRLRSFHELIAKRRGIGVDRLISRLKKDFNGDFLEPKDIKWKTLDTRALEIVDQLLSRVNIQTGQLDFWNYDFSQIPVELLSGIYETFLQEDQKLEGAYYTPRLLAELAVNQAFEGTDDPSTLRIYDGACGSGILLTTAYRKLLAGLQGSADRPIDIADRITLLKKSIFGSDINQIACRVTAFSLYLCLLERLTPSDLARLQQDHSCKLPKLIGNNIAEGKIKGDFFSEKNPFSSSRSFDVVISNPPWRELRGNEGLAAVKWATRNKVRLPHKQIAASFAAKASEAARDSGRIILILPSSLITAPTNADFLRQFSVRVCIERLINLADFRRLLFAHAEHACTILKATNAPGLKSGRLLGNFDYWTPKVDISFAFNRLTLHDYDTLLLPRDALIDDNSILRRRFWGSRRDENLVQRLAAWPRIGDAIATKQGWVTAKGYHFRDGNKQVDPSPLRSLKYLPTDSLNSSSPIVDLHKLVRPPFDRGVASLGNVSMYRGPRILWPDGTSTEIEVRAAYAEAPFCFSSAVGGLKVPPRDRLLARFLTCYLRSSLAKYWLIMTGYSASAERSRVTLNEIKSLPFSEPKLHPNPQLAKSLLTRVDSELARFEISGASIFASDTYDFARDNIDELIFSYFEIAEHEKIQIQDVVNLVAKSLQPTSYSDLLTPLQEAVTLEATNAYLCALKDGLHVRSKSRGGQGNLEAKIYNRGHSRMPLDVVHLALDGNLDRSGRSPQSGSVQALLQAISEKVSDGAVNFFAIPNSIFVWGNDIYIVKPGRSRFWTRSAALRDGDEIFDLLIANSSGGAA